MKTDEDIAPNSFQSEASVPQAILSRNRNVTIVGSPYIQAQFGFIVGTMLIGFDGDPPAPSR
jgi:hypothetical protein